MPVQVFLVGEALVDEFHDAHVAGGAPFNVARSLAALAQPQQIGLVSALNPGDAAGQCLLASMRRFGLMDAGLQQVAAWPSGRVTVTEQEGGHAFHIQGPAAWDQIALVPAAALLAEWRPKVFYFGSLAQRQQPARATVQALAEQARRQGALCYLDLNLREGVSEPELAAASLQRADWLKVNDGELAQLLSWFGEPAGLDVLGPAARLSPAVCGLQQRFGLQCLLLTRGSQGYAAFGGEGQLLAEAGSEALPQWVDAVGAGDAFSAMLLAATLEGQVLPAALALANRYAGAICGQRGPIPADDGFFLPWRALLNGSA